MDELGIVHIQQDKQFRAAQGIAWLNIAMGLNRTIRHKPVAMLSMLEYISTAVMSNERNDPKAATWVYFDEIYLLLRDSLSANFLYTSWKRFRKYNAYATGITQNMQDCLTNDTAYAMLANSEFVVMLRQTKDIDSVVELYGLSEPQRKYLLLA